MEKINILLADDDLEILELVRAYLSADGYNVSCASSGDEALLLFKMTTYHLVILDIMMPGLDGIEVCRQIRNISNVPIIFLSAKTEELDKMLGLSIGADDYVTKPFSPKEFTAKIKATLRRYLSFGTFKAEDKKNIYELCDLKINLNSYEIYRGDEEIKLTAKEFEILKFLIQNPNQVFTKRQIFNQVWNETYVEDDNTVTVHIKRLRNKIEKDPKNPVIVQTVWGIGYKLGGVNL